MKTLNHHSSGSKKKSSNTSLDVVAANAIKLLSNLEKELGLVRSASPVDRQQIRSLSRVPPEAFAIAAHIVASDPQGFHEFDAAELADAAAYATAMAGVLKRAQGLVANVQSSIYRHRLPASKKTLAVYAMVKGLGRVVENTDLRALVNDLNSKLTLGPKRKLPSDVKTERKLAKKKATKVAHLKAKLAAVEGPSNAAPQAPPTPAPPPDKNAGVTVTVSGNPNLH